MLFKCELSVVPDTHEDQEEFQNICFQTMVMLGCHVATAQFRLKKPVSHLKELRVNIVITDQSTTLSTSLYLDATIMSILRALRVISVGTHKGLILEFGLKIIYACQKGGGENGALGQTFLDSSRGANGTVHTHSGCAVYEPRGSSFCEATGNAHLRHIHQDSGTPKNDRTPD